MPKRVGHTARILGRHFLREWRNFRDLTQEELADLTGQSNANLSRIERFEQAYTQDVLELVAEALETDPASILVRNPLADAEDISVLYARASPEIRRAVDLLLRAQASREERILDIDLNKVTRGVRSLIHELEPMEAKIATRKIAKTSSKTTQIRERPDNQNAKTRPRKSR